MGIRLKVATLLRTRKKHQMEAAAAKNGTRFWCASLAGSAKHSLSVLCDMTVTCCCEDHGPGSMIGDLSQQTLEECLNGPAAQQLKQSLAQGHLPLLNCVVCRSLRQCPAGEAEGHLLDHGVPKRDLMVENTVACNISCRGCPRKRTLKLRNKTTLSNEDVEKIAREAGEHRIQQISFLSSGEPFLPSDVWGQLKTLRRYNPEARIVTSSNGQMLDSDEKREAALMLDEILFSVHGCTEESVGRYQKKSSFEKAYANMRDLVAFRNARGKKRPVVVWKYVLFNWNDSKEMILRATRLAEKAGINRIMFWPTTRPLSGTSWRWYLGRFPRHFGKKGSKGQGREVVFPLTDKPLA